MKKNNIFSAILTMCLVLTGAVSFTACSNDDLDTNQYVSGVALNVYGPSPVMRGGTLRFLGSNLEQVAQVEIPGVSPITNIEVVKAGVPSEIRVIVPHDGPVPGLVKLTTKTGTVITTITELNYTEGLDPANITMPASAMPGETIRLTVPESGDDYLDLIHMVEFSDGVQVGENDFTAHTRYLLELVVPEEAKTGKLSLYTADLTASEVDANEVSYQIITTEKAIEIGVPTVSKIASPRGEDGVQGTVTAKSGETITLTGTYYNLVSAVMFGNDVKCSDITVNDGGKTLTFALPAEAPDGDIIIVCKSGVEVPAGTLTSVKPSNCVAHPIPVKAGQPLQIDGSDMDLVIDVEFADANGEYTIGNNQNVINTIQAYAVYVPETAVEGNLRLVLANGSRVDVPFTLVKPTVTGYNTSSVSAGGALTIKGTDLDLVKTIKFGESDVVKGDDLKIAEDGTSISLTVPMNAQSGVPTLTLANTTTVEEVPTLTIEEAVFCYFTEMPDEDAELKAGTSFVLPVANGDKLTGVEINNETCQYILSSGNQLIIGIPAKAKKGSKVRLISSNGEITYSIDFIPNTEVTTVLWTGQAVADNWGNQPYVLSDAGIELVNAGVAVGDIISFHITPMEADWKVEFVEGHWGPTYKSICSVGNDTEGGKFTEYDLDANKGYFNLEVTQEMLDAALTQQWWGGVFVLNGDNVIVDRITTTHYESVEETLWTGEAVVDDWGNQPYILSDGGTELLAAGMKVGSIIRIYLTPTDATWNCQVVDGHWGPTFDGCDFSSGNWDLSAHNNALEVVVTEAIYNSITAVGGWGGSFILNGDNVVATKVTIE